VSQCVLLLMQTLHKCFLAIFKVKQNLNNKIVMITLVVACKSALLVRSSASVSVCPFCDAHIAQVYPS
jgi:hypothetical protein